MSNSKNVRIQKLNIEKMPGLPNGISTFNELDKNLVLINGPNASGKSSTARALMQLLWIENNHDIIAETTFKLGNDRWEIRMDNGNSKMWKNGELTEERPVLSEFSNRYMLSLKELIKRNESELALQLTEEAYGGLSIKDVIESEGYSLDGYTRSKTEYTKYKNALKEYNEILAKQKSLSEEENKIKVLFRKQKQLEKSLRTKELLVKAIEYKRQDDKCNKLKNDINACDDILESLLTFPYEDVEKWEKERSQAQQKISEASALKTDFRKKHNKLSITDDDISAQKIHELSELKQNIDRLEEKINDKEDELLGAKNTLISISEKFGYTEKENLKNWSKYEKLIHLGLSDINALDLLVENYNQNKAGHLTSSSLIDKLHELEKNRKNSDREPSTYEEGIQSLSKWLKENRSRHSLNRKTFGIYVILSALILAITIYFTYENTRNEILLWTLLVFIVFSLIYFLITTVLINSTGKVRIEDYRNTGLTEPTEWNNASVSAMLETLIEKQANAYRVNEIKQDLKAAETTYQNQKEIIDEYRDKIIKHPSNISDQIKLSETDLSINAINRYAKSIEEWQQANNNYLTLSEQCSTLEKERDEKISQFNDIIKNTAIQSCSTQEEVSAAHKMVNENIDNSKTLRSDIESANNKVENARKEFNKKNDAIENAYQNIGKSENDRDLIFRHRGEIDEYNDLKVKLSKEKIILDSKETDYNNALKVVEETDKYLDLTEEELKRRIENVEDAQHKRDEVKDEIKVIETKIDQAKQGNDLEKALNEKEEARDALLEMYEENLTENIGMIILDALQDQEKEQNQPEVLDRANDIMSAITYGKYQISMSSETDKPQFMGLDTERQRKLPLRHLSLGTRTHLILALRIASIEQQEKQGNCRMPLFADEMLGNTDDQRSEAIIQALIEISKSGRQIFYFTAQEDEMRKWKAHLRKHEVSYSAYELTGKENKEAVKLRELQELPSPIELKSNIPQPAELKNKSAYKKLLTEHGVQIKEFNLLSDNISEAHLWYLLEEMEVLYNLMDNYIMKWGQLKTMAEYDSFYNEIVENHNLDNKINILKRFQSLYKTGRPVLIDRTALHKCNVRKSIIDKVAALMEEVNYNPRELINRIEEIKGIGESISEDIKEAFYKNGYLSEKEPLNDEEIRRRMAAIFDKSPFTAEEIQDFLNQFSEQG